MPAAGRTDASMGNLTSVDGCLLPALLRIVAQEAARYHLRNQDEEELCSDVLYYLAQAMASRRSPRNAAAWVRRASRNLLRWKRFADPVQYVDPADMEDLAPRLRDLRLSENGEPGLPTLATLLSLVPQLQLRPAEAILCREIPSCRTIRELAERLCLAPSSVRRLMKTLGARVRKSLARPLQRGLIPRSIHELIAQDAEAASAVNAAKQPANVPLPLH
jgi:hypothetical protein